MKKLDFKYCTTRVWDVIQSSDKKFSIGDILDQTALDVKHVVHAIKYLQSKGKIELDDDWYTTLFHVRGWTVVKQEKKK